MFTQSKANWRCFKCQPCDILIVLSVPVWLWHRSTSVWEIEQSKLSEEPLPVVYLRSLSCDSVSWGGCVRPEWGGNMVALLILLMWTRLPPPHPPPPPPPWLSKVSTQPLWRQSPPEPCTSSCTPHTSTCAHKFLKGDEPGTYTSREFCISPSFNRRWVFRVVERREEKVGSEYTCKVNLKL